MAEKKGRAAARKVKDKWKSKTWYNILAPEMFDRQVLGESPADDAGKLTGRVAEVTVQDLTGDFSKMHIKLQFKVQDVHGSEARTQFVGHDMTSDYIRRQTRRKRTRTDGIFDVVTKDNWRLRLKAMAITDRRIQSSKQRAIRQIMEAVVRETATKSTIGELVKAIISGDLSKQVAIACKPIQPISRVEIRKSEVTAMGLIPEPLPASEESPPPAPEAPAPTEGMPETGEPSPAPAEAEVPEKPPSDEESPSGG